MNDAELRKIEEVARELSDRARTAMRTLGSENSEDAGLLGLKTMARVGEWAIRGVLPVLEEILEQRAEDQSQGFPW